MNHHSGEVSFPGGRFDPSIDRDLTAAALREVYEEIGVPSEKVKIIGNLDDSPTISGYIIRPFVGVLSLPENFQFVPNHDEVGTIFTVPIEFFMDKTHFQETALTQFGSEFGLINIPFQDPITHKTYHIWGATAHLISRYLKTIYELEVTSSKYRRPTLEEINIGRKQYELEKIVKMRKEKMDKDKKS